MGIRGATVFQAQRETPETLVPQDSRASHLLGSGETQECKVTQETQELKGHQEHKVTQETRQLKGQWECKVTQETRELKDQLE